MARKGQESRVSHDLPRITKTTHMCINNGVGLVRMVLINVLKRTANPLSAAGSMGFEMTTGEQLVTTPQARAFYEGSLLNANDFYRKTAFVVKFVRS